jgi:hypothetical protein
MHRGIGPDDAKAIAESAYIRFDDAYFASRERRLFDERTANQMGLSPGANTLTFTVESARISKTNLP